MSVPIAGGLQASVGVPIAGGLQASVGVPVAGGLQASGTAAQQPTFRSNTRLIVQTVSVKDRSGNPVEGLTAADFIVTEDNERQDIAFVEFQRLVFPAAEPGAVPQVAAAPTVPARPASDASAVTATGIAVPPAGDARFRDRRLLILYFDMTAMPPGDLARAYQASLKYIGSEMQPADLVAIIAFSGGGVTVKQDFTDDRAALVEVINVMIFGEDKDGDGVRDQEDVATAFGQNDAEFNIFNTDRQLAALQTAVTMLRPFPEQKSLVYFGSGLRLNGTDNLAQLRATTNAAVRANVAIFPVDARGLVAEAPLGNATQASPSGVGMFSGRLAEAAVTRFQRSQDTLFSLAKDTGGEALFNSNDLAAGIVRAADAQSSYYIIGYYSTHTAADGRFRRVRIALANDRDYDVAYRQGYYGDKEWARQTGAERERQLEEALMLENPITDITIALEVNYFQLNRAEYFIPLAVKIPGSELALARRRGAQRTVLDFIAEVKDDFGVTHQNVRDNLDIRLTDSTAAELASRPIQYETGFTLLPGNYVLKFLVRDAETGRIGTYQTSFTIPNLNREVQRVPISSVVLASQRVPLTDAIFNVRNNTSTSALQTHPLVFDGQKLLPSVTRVFSQSREMFVYLQAYQREATTTQPMAAFVTFYQGDVKAYETGPVAVTDGLDPRSKAVPLRISVPLGELPVGPYDCQVTVLDPTGNRASFWRASVVIVP